MEIFRNLLLANGSWCSMAWFVTRVQGISEGMQPPSPLATTLTTLSCIGLVVWTFVSHGRATSGLAVMSFAVLSLQLLGTEKPRFSQLTSSVFGLFYCGQSTRSMVTDSVSAVHIVHSLRVAVVRHGWYQRVRQHTGSHGHCSPFAFISSDPGVGCGAGYLPSFWIKLRMLSAPAVNTVLARHYPVRALLHFVALLGCRCALSGGLAALLVSAQSAGPYAV